MCKRLIGSILLLGCLSITASAQFFKRNEELFKNTKYFGLDIDFMAWGTMPVLYFDFAEMDLLRVKSGSFRILPYALEISGYEKPMDKNNNYMYSFFAHNFGAITYEHYFRVNRKVILPPRLLSLYAKTSYAIISKNKTVIHSTTNSTLEDIPVTSGVFYTPYLELGGKMYVGAQAFEDAAIYWSALSVGYIIGGDHLHKMAKFNSNGFFINFEFNLGLLKPYQKME